MTEDLKPLQFTSNVIELKPDKKYLLLFKEINYHQLEQINEYLRSQGFHCICIGTLGQDVQVIEAPAKPEPDPSEFWRNMSRDMTINERRVVFAKLAEALGVPVDSDGNAVIDGESRRFSLDEAKMITKPHWEIEFS